MQKARSRLSINFSQEETSGRKNRLPAHKLSFFQSYLKYLPTLLISLPFYAGVGYILIKIEPQDIQHLVLANSYAPFQGLLFLGNFFFLSFLLQKTRRGLLASLGIGIIIFLKLQRVIITDQIVFMVVGSVMGLMFGGEVLALLRSRLKPSASEPRRQST